MVHNKDSFNLKHFDLTDVIHRFTIYIIMYSSTKYFEWWLAKYTFYFQ